MNHLLAFWLIPEIRSLHRAERARLFKRAAQRAFEEAPYSNLIVAAPVLGVLMVLVYSANVLSLPFRSRNVYVVAIALIALSGPLGCLVYRKRIRWNVRQALRETGILICLNCGYDLRGQISSRCPECGTPMFPSSP